MKEIEGELYYVESFAAPEGSCYFDSEGLYPAHYISVWKNEYEEYFYVPIGIFSLDPSFCGYEAKGELSHGIELITCLTCMDLLRLCRIVEHSSQYEFLEDTYYLVISGQIKSTKGVFEFFKKNKDYLDLSELKNDGTFRRGWNWREMLDDDGLIKEEYRFIDWPWK